MADRLGIIDWGIGGVGIYKLIRERMRVPVTYFSDTGVTPYGKMARGDLAMRLDKVIGFMATLGATRVVVGCNAASTVIPDLSHRSVPVSGVIEAGVAAAVEANPARLGLIGGRRTIVSGSYRRAFTGHGIAVIQRVAQPLSGMIERGDISSAELHEESRRILAPLKTCSHILLACTHYPAITRVLAAHVSQRTKFIDPAEHLVAGLQGLRLKGVGNDEFFTSGDPEAMTRSAKAAWDVTLRSVKVCKQ